MRNRRTKSSDPCRYATHHGRDDETAAEGRRLEKALEIGLEDTFPASDAVAVVQPGHPDLEAPDSASA